MGGADQSRELAVMKAPTEGALVKYCEHLEELVKEQATTLEAVREELLRKERLAVLGQLVGMVSHDIRNPLGTIRNSLFIVKRRVGGHDEYVDRALARTERGIQRCENLVQELMTCARTQAPKLTTTDIDYWLDELLHEMPIPESIRLIKKLSSGAELPIDRERLGRCVLNVVENACQAVSGRESRIWPEVTVESSVCEGRVQIRVRDTGPGIPAGLIEKVFEPLYTTKASGVGLGLTIVRQIMRQHAGDVEIKSREDEGTLVTLWLPRGQQEVQVEETAHSCCR